MLLRLCDVAKLRSPAMLNPVSVGKTIPFCGSQTLLTALSAGDDSGKQVIHVDL